MSAMMLFHATYEALMPDILEHGLCRSHIGQKAWPDCSSEFIYLNQSADIAASFCEASEDVPEEWLDEITIIAVRVEALDASLFSMDDNITDISQIASYQYRGDIPPSALIAYWERK